MSAQRLSGRSIRRIERDVHQPLAMAWSHGGYWMDFVTVLHRHGVWHKRDGEVRWEDRGCYTTCPKPEDNVLVWAKNMRSQW